MADEITSPENAPAEEATDPAVAEQIAPESGAGTDAPAAAEEAPKAEEAAPQDAPAEEPADEPAPAKEVFSEDELAEDAPAEPAPAEAAPSGGDGSAGVELPGEPTTESSASEAPATPKDDTTEPSPAEGVADGDQKPEDKEEAAPEASEPPAPSEPMKVIPHDPYSPIFAGASHPSPAPDIAEEDKLPHPSLTMTPGFISGTTAATQGAMPVPGDAAQAQAVAAIISGSAIVPPAAMPSQTLDAGATPAETDAKRSGQTDGATAAVSQDAPESSSHPDAAPTANLSPTIFDQLSKDGEEVKKALAELGKAKAHVLVLELKGLANLAVSLSQRLEKDDCDDVQDNLPEPFTRAYEAAQQLVELAKELFEADASDVIEADVLEPEHVLGELGLDGDEADG